MKYFNLIISVLVFTVVLFGCSGEKNDSPLNTNQTDYSKYFPMTIGSWWVTEHYALDENMNRNELVFKDSIVVIDKKMVGGNLATVMITYDLEADSPVDTSYYYMDGSKVYEYINITPFSEGKDWKLMEDFAASKGWNILDTNVSNIDMGDGLVFTGNFKADIKPGSGKSLEIKGMNFQTKAFDISIIMTGDATINGMTAPMTMNVKGNNYFAEGIGQVQIINSIEMAFSGQSFKENQESIVVDYNIK